MDATLIFESALLVEDDAAHRLLIERIVKRSVREVISAPTLGAATTYLKQRMFDVIVTDLHLPDSGRDGPVPHLVVFNSPVLVLTSASTVKDAVGAMQRGALDFLIKDFDSLSETVPIALSRIWNHRELTKERERFSKLSTALTGIVEQSQDGVALLSADGEVVYANRSFQLLLGEGKSFRDLVSVEVMQQVLKLAALSSSSGATWSGESSRAVEGSGNLAVAITVSRMLQPHPELNTSLVCFVRDVSSAHSRERFQRDLISTTTHDLRGPLGSIRLSAELLTGLLEQKTKPYEIAIRVQSSAQGALQLIDEFLSARRIEEGTLILRPKVQPLGTLVNEVLDDLKPIAQARKLTLSNDLFLSDLVSSDLVSEPAPGDAREPNRDVEVNVDGPAMKRVLANLIGNALKFTPAGGTIKISGRKVFDGVEIDISDTGAGMAPHEVASLFERFVRLERHHEVAGTGLGLFLVKSVVEAHGGAVRVSSEMGKGTTFTLALPAFPPVNERGELVDLAAAMR